MKLGKFLKWVSIVTVLALVYIHMQMQIIGLAYEGNAKEEQIRELSEGLDSFCRA